MSGTCINGRVNISSDVKLRLFADSAGYCNCPECNRYLFSEISVANYNIGEMAHIIAAAAQGPRATEVISAKEKAEYENLILLCPSCHTEIDKAPDIFPVDLIQDWNVNHKTRISNIITIPKFENRIDAREYVVKLLRANKVIFDNLNPDLPYKENPEAEEALVWRKKMLLQIIPKPENFKFSRLEP